MKKRILSLFLVAALTMSFVGCKNEPPSKTTTPLETEAAINKEANEITQNAFSNCMKKTTVRGNVGVYCKIKTGKKKNKKDVSLVQTQAFSFAVTPQKGLYYKKGTDMVKYKGENEGSDYEEYVIQSGEKEIIHYKILNDWGKDITEADTMDKISAFVNLDYSKISIQKMEENEKEYTMTGEIPNDFALELARAYGFQKETLELIRSVGSGVSLTMTIDKSSNLPTTIKLDTESFFDGKQDLLKEYFNLKLLHGFSYSISITNLKYSKKAMTIPKKFTR